MIYKKTFSLLMILLSLAIASSGKDLICDKAGQVVVDRGSYKACDCDFSNGYLRDLDPQKCIKCEGVPNREASSWSCDCKQGYGGDAQDNCVKCGANQYTLNNRCACDYGFVGDPTNPQGDCTPVSVTPQTDAKTDDLKIGVTHDPGKKPWFGDPPIVGEAQIDSGTGSGKPIKLFLGDTVTAPSNGEVIIRAGTQVYHLSRGSSLKLETNTVEDGRSRITSTSLLGGFVKFLIPPRESSDNKFGVKSGTVILGVKGTQFVVDSSQGKDDVYVTDGVVVVSNIATPSQKTDLLAGRGISSTAKGLEEPRIVKAQDLVQKYPELFKGARYTEDATIKDLKTDIDDNRYVGSENAARSPNALSWVLILAGMLICVIVYLRLFHKKK